ESWIERVESGENLDGRRGDQKAALDLAAAFAFCQERRGMHGREHAETMSDKNDRPRLARDFLDDAIPPGGKPRLLPVGLIDTAGRRQFGIPAALPMIRLRTAKPRNDEKAGLECTHRMARRGFRWNQRPRSRHRARARGST